MIYAFKIYWVVGMIVTCLAVHTSEFKKGIREGQVKSGHQPGWNFMVMICTLLLTLVWPLIIIEALAKGKKS